MTPSVAIAARDDDDIAVVRQITFVGELNWRAVISFSLMLVMPPTSRSFRHAAAAADETRGPWSEQKSSATNGSICSSRHSMHSAQSPGRVDPPGCVVICLPVNFKRDYGLHRIPSSHVTPPGDSHASAPDDDCQSVSITTRRICSVTAEYTAPLVHGRLHC